MNGFPPVTATGRPCRSAQCTRRRELRRLVLACRHYRRRLGGRGDYPRVAKRSARQTEDAKFWLLTGPLATHPLKRQIVLRKNMTVIDSARFLAVISAAEADAMIAVLDAKYNYAFWRPVTAIRNGDIDGNDATERAATWLPIDNTPMHPEYPCAHCIVSSTVAAAIEAMLGTADIGEVAMVSPTVTHRWSNLNAYTDEVAEARICAGFHYRFSTLAGRQMGRNIGTYVAQTVLVPSPNARAPSD